MTTPSTPLPLDDAHSQELPEELQEIARRLQTAINEALVATEKVDEHSTSAQLSAEVERELPADSAVSQAGAVIDRRLYLPAAEGWEFRVKFGTREHCSHRNPGEEWFHLLVDGELFLQFGDERFCLNCAFRSGILTDDRLFWQTGRGRPRIFPLADAGPVAEIAE